MYVHAIMIFVETTPGIKVGDKDSRGGKFLYDIFNTL
jgi:hypothetical protein